MSRILILDGTPTDSPSAIPESLDLLVAGLKGRGHTVTRFLLREQDLKPCIGCWHCWLKTPGLCSVPDDTHQIRHAWRHSDLVILASPILAGFVSALLKTVVDKFIPLALPYFTLVDGESVHFHRYEPMPTLACMLDGDEPDVQILTDWVQRCAAHTRSPFLFSARPGDDLGALLHKVDGLGEAPWHDPAPLGGPTPFIPRDPTPVDFHAPMRLTLFNGSPRGPKGNTEIVLQEFRAGFESAGGEAVDVHNLHTTRRMRAAVAAYGECEHALLAFPLYVHAMPGRVQQFIEAIAHLPPRQGRGLAFIVQSGFSESRQSHWLAPALQRLPTRLGAVPTGLAIRGGMEGLRLMPPWMSRKPRRLFRKLGVSLATEGRFKPAVVKSLAVPVERNTMGRLLFRASRWTGLADAYWDSKLKKNGAWGQRLARPYDGASMPAVPSNIPSAPDP